MVVELRMVVVVEGLRIAVVVEGWIMTIVVEGWCRRAVPVEGWQTELGLRHHNQEVNLGTRPPHRYVQPAVAD